MGSLRPEMIVVERDMHLSLGLVKSSKGINKTPLALQLLSALLERTIQRNEKLLQSTKKGDAVTIFHGLRAPDLTIRQYIDRIFKYAKCSPSCFILADIYINKFLEQPNIHLTSLNVHRLLITSVMVAAKFNDDAFFNNAYYAKVGGISTKEINRLEMNFLFSLDFKLQVTVESFSWFCSELEQEATVGGHHLDRPIQACRLGGWGNAEESSGQQAMQRCG